MLHTAHPHECRWQCWDCLYGQYRAATQEYLMYSPSKGFAESVIAEYFPYTTFLRLLSLDYFPYMPAEYSMLSKSQAQMYQNTLTNP